MSLYLVLWRDSFRLGVLIAKNKHDVPGYLGCD